MKRLIAILAMLLLGPAMAQEIVPGPYVPPPLETPNLIYTTKNPPPEGSSYNWTGFIPNNTNGGGLQGGNIPAYNTLTGTFLFGYTQGNIKYVLNNSPDVPNTQGYEVGGFTYSWEYFNQDFSRGSLSVTVNFIAPNKTLLESFSVSLPKTTNGWTLDEGIYAFSHPYDRPDIGSLELILTGNDDRFWAGYYGPQIRAIDISALYNPTPPPAPNFSYWTNLVGEWGTFTLTDTTTVRYGAEGSYIYATLQPGTYACNSFEWGRDPAGGLEKSCQGGTNVDPNPPQTDCTITPSDPSCAIKTYTDPNTIATNLAEAAAATTVTQLASVEMPTNTTTTSTATTTPVVETVATTTVTPTQTITPVADLVVAATNPVAAPTSEAAYRELTDEEKAAMLADAISKNAIEGALAIAADSTSKSLAGNDGQNFGTTTTTVTKNSNSFDLQNSTNTDTTDTSSNIDILETGRQSGIAALNTTLAQTETISLETVQQAENISSLSSQESQQFGTESQVANEVKDMGIDNVIETVNNVLQLVESNINSQNSSNPNYTGLSEDEQTTIANDPVLASTFNVGTNFANLEILGVIKPVEEKSDAEKRAEEVVAANAKEQEEINNNYMNADQSGLVAAIGADADVSSYRKAMLPDNNLWYRPEDIYKNVSYKDNVRGMYFLEKGNTDTYKQMVEEQYK